MSDSGKPDRWNSLLENLGVPVSEKPPAAETPTTPEAAAESAPEAQRPQTISALPPPKAKAKPAPKPKAGPPAAKSPSYWSRIAGALGLEVPPEPEPAPEPPKPERRAEPPARVEQPRAETHRAERSEPRREAPPAPAHPAPAAREPREGEPEPWGRREQPRTPLDDLFGETAEDVDVFSLGEKEEPSRREPSRREPPRRRKEEERGPVLDYDVESADLSLGEDEDAERPPRREEGLERGEGEGDRPRRRRRRRGRGRRGREEGGAAPREALPPRREGERAPAAAEADFDFDRDEEIDSDLDEPLGQRERDAEDLLPPGEAPPRRREPAAGEAPAGDRPRRRRRGRGGRDRDREGIRAEQPAVYEPDEEDELVPPSRPAAPSRAAGQRPPRPPRHAESHALAPHGDEPDDLDLADEGDEEHGGGHMAHRKIPTWQEAVGILIDANMSVRSTSPDRDRDRGRGRGRGRR